MIELLGFTERISDIIALYTCDPMLYAVLHCCKQILFNFLCFLGRKKGLDVFRSIFCTYAVRFTAFVQKKFSTLKAMVFRGYACHFQNPTVYTDGMTTYSFQNNRNFSADMIEVVSGGHTFLTFCKQFLIPSQSV